MFRDCHFAAITCALVTPLIGANAAASNPNAKVILTQTLD